MRPTLDLMHKMEPSRYSRPIVPSHFYASLMLTRMLNPMTQRPLSVEALESRHLLAVTGQVADFALLDVNPTSSTYNQTISPRDYLGEVSAWYFGHAT